MKYVALFLAFVMTFSITVCSFAETELSPEEKAELQEKIEQNRALPEHQEGYVEEADGCYYEVRWCKNGDNNIYGEFCFPADFDSSATYPVIIYCHQNNGSHKSFKKPGWLAYMANNGKFIGYTFDFCGGTPAPNCLSDLDYSESTDETQVSDLNAIIEFVKSQPFCNPDQVYLLGGSRGGRDVALCGAEHSDDIAGLILLYAAIDVNSAGFESAMDKISGYTGDVLLIHGIKDPTVPYESSVNAFLNAYADAHSQLLLLSGKGAAHSFDGVNPQLRDVAESAVLEFVNMHIKEYPKK